jgi:hypothetical protein
MTNWLITVRPAGLGGGVDVDALVQEPSREVAGYTRVVVEALRKHIRRRAKLEARRDAQHKARRRGFKRVMAGKTAKASA